MAYFSKPRSAPPKDLPQYGWIFDYKMDNPDPVRVHSVRFRKFSKYLICASIKRYIFEGTEMKFVDTQPNLPWWHDAQIPGNTQRLDTDTIYNVFFARAAVGGHPIRTLEWSGNYREGLKAPEFLVELTALLKEKFGARMSGEGHIDEKWPMANLFVWDRGAIKADVYQKRAGVEVMTDDAGVLEVMKEYLRKTLIEIPPQGSVYMMTATSSGPEFHSVGVGGHPLERANYESKVLEAYDRIAEDVKSVSPRGRLSILDGPPGCGKTYLIRGLLNEVSDVLFVVVPPHFLPSLAEPSSLSAVIRLKEEHEKPIVFIVEDADECLAPREEGNMSAISMVLNLGDGIVGSVLDVRIVATTNAQHGELDPAIRRPGRLTACETVGPLSVDKAREVYLRLSDQKSDVSIITKPMTLAEIYQLAYDSGWRGIRKVDRKVGFEK